MIIGVDEWITLECYHISSVYYYVSYSLWGWSIFDIYHCVSLHFISLVLSFYLFLFILYMFLNSYLFCCFFQCQLLSLFHSQTNVFLSQNYLLLALNTLRGLFRWIAMSCVLNYSMVHVTSLPTRLLIGSIDYDKEISYIPPCVHIALMEPLYIIIKLSIAFLFSLCSFCDVIP